MLEKFDELFAVLKDDDAQKMKSILRWAQSDGRKEISPELAALAGALTDAEVEEKIGTMQAARKAKKFAESDAIRAELVSAGILVENTKDGVRWRRK